MLLMALLVTSPNTSIRLPLHLQGGLPTTVKQFSVIAFLVESGM